MPRFIIASFASLLATAAHAQDAPVVLTPDHARENEVTVTAFRDREPISRAGQSVSVLGPRDIELRQRTDVADLLRELPGVAVARNGGPGAVATLRIRGADSDQTLVLVDGVRLNDPAAVGGGFDFGNLLVGNIRRVELLRGPASVLWGSQAIGGVVAVETLRPASDDPALNLRAEGGSFDAWTLAGNASVKAGPVALSAGGGRFVTDGISAFGGGSERDGFKQTAANARAVIDLSDDAAIDLRGHWARGRVDLDGFAPPTFAFADTADEQRTVQKLGYAGVNLRTGPVRHRLAVAASGTERENFNRTRTPVVNFRSDGTATRFEYHGVADLAEAAGLTFGAETERTALLTQSFGAFAGPATRGRSRSSSVYAQGVADVAAGVTLTAGLRHDDHDRFGGATTAAAALSASPDGGETIFRGSFAQGFKAPTLFQLQSDFGNAALRPERSDGFDGSVTRRVGDGEISVAAYTRTTRDLIDFVSCFRVASPICAGRPFGTYDNVLRARARGVEVAGRLPIGRLTAQAQYSFTDARNRTAGSANFDRELARRPRHAASARLDWEGRGVDLGVSVYHAGRSFDDAANNLRLASYTLIGLTAAVEVAEGVDVTARVDNLFDKTYETARLYGSPPRTFALGVRASL